MYINDTEYQEFSAWKSQRDALQREAELVRETKDRLRQSHDDWERKLRIDRELKRGIEDGLSWSEYVRATAAPSDLRSRYLQLEKEAGPQARETDRDRLFMQGFTKGV